MSLDMTSNERNILQNFFDSIIDTNTHDNSVSDLKIVKDTNNKLKIALRDAEHRCTCARLTWGGICEVCQASDKELAYLRNFFQQIRDAKKNGMTTTEIQEFIENTKYWLTEKPAKRAK